MRLWSSILCRTKTSVADNVYDYVAKVGFDPVFGARPLRRAIQNEIEDPLSKMILEGKLQPNKSYELNESAEGKLECKLLPSQDGATAQIQQRS